MYIFLQIDHWLEYSVRSINLQSNSANILSHLDTVLKDRDYLVGTLFSLGDIAVFSGLKGIVTVTLFDYLHFARNQCQSR